MRDDFIASRNQRCFSCVPNKNQSYFNNCNCNILKLVLKSRQANFVIRFALVVKSSRQFIREIDFFYLIFNFEIIFNEQKSLLKLTTIKKRCCYKIL